MAYHVPPHHLPPPVLHQHHQHRDQEALVVSPQFILAVMCSALALHSDAHSDAHICNDLESKAELKPTAGFMV